MQISLNLNAGRSTLTINGITAPLRDSEDVTTAWKVIKAALFAKHPQYSIAKLLRAS